MSNVRPSIAGPLPAVARVPDAARMMVALKPSGLGIAIWFVAANSSPAPGTSREARPRCRFRTHEDHVAKILALPQVATFAPSIVEVQAGTYADPEGRFELHTHIPEPFDISRFAVVFLCDLDEDLSRRWHAHGHAHGKLVNDADVPHRCDFDVPALHCDGPVRVAIDRRPRTRHGGPHPQGDRADAAPDRRRSRATLWRAASLEQSTVGRPRLRRLAQSASFQELATLDTGDELRARRTLSQVADDGRVVLIGAGPGRPGSC